eukprot:403355223
MKLFMQNQLKHKLLLIILISLVLLCKIIDARGKKKKRSASVASCSLKGLDCSATCCLDVTCATDLADCAGYINRELDELYLGFGSVIGLIVGLPIVLWFFNICIMHKFCANQEDESGSYSSGGFTICQVLIKILTCFSLFKKKSNKNVSNDTLQEQEDEFDVDIEEMVQANQHKKLKNSHSKQKGNSIQTDKHENQIEQDSNQIDKYINDFTNQNQTRNQNNCVKCLCIVFCCLDSNIKRDKNGKNYQYKYEASSSKDDDGRGSDNISNQFNKIKLQKDSHQSLHDEYKVLNDLKVDKQDKLNKIEELSQNYDENNSEQDQLNMDQNQSDEDFEEKGLQSQKSINLQTNSQENFLHQNHSQVIN